MDPLVGRTLDNKYLVEKLLGKGGMGSVYQALHTGTKRTVAVKVIAQQYMRNRELLIRFQREAEASGRLRHPNVVNVTDFGVTLIDTTPVAYLTMEYLDGETLHEYLQKERFVPPALAIEILEQVSLGVTEAHSFGILHRDLKPQNIWLQPDGRGGFIIKVLDFGIAKLADPSAVPMDLPDLEAAPNEIETSQDENATQVLAPTEMGLTSAFAESSGFATTIGSTLGTPAFMSPEQCGGRAVSEKSDLYSLAMMAYLMFAGELPFKGNARDLIEQQITLTPDPPHTRNPRLSETVSRVILESLNKDPDYRAPNPLAFVARLRAAVEGEVFILKESRSRSGTNPGIWFIIIFTSILIPAALLSGARYLARMALDRELLAPWQIFALVVFIHASLAYAACVFADLAMTLWSAHTRSEEATVRDYLRMTMKTVRTFPAAFGASTLTLHPARHAIAHIVVLLEGLGRKAAQARSETLLRGSEHVAIALLVRRLAVSVAVTLYLPVVLILAQMPVRIVFREYFGEMFSGSLALASFSFMPIYGSFLMSWMMLYDRARRGFGEESPEATRRYLPSKGKVGQRFRLGTILWAALPIILLLTLIVPPLLNYNERANEALSTSVLEGRYEDAVRALDKGAEVNQGRGPGRSPLMAAVQNGDLRMAELLVSRGARTRDAPATAGTLHYAVLRRRREMVRFLLDHGANVDALDSTRDSPLSLAAKSGQLETVRLLMARGADRNLRDADGKTAADHARAQGHQDVLQALEAK